MGSLFKRIEENMSQVKVADRFVSHALVYEGLTIVSNRLKALTAGNAQLVASARKELQTYKS